MHNGTDCGRHTVRLVGSGSSITVEVRESNGKGGSHNLAEVSKGEKSNSIFSRRKNNKSWLLLEGIRTREVCEA